MKSKPILLIGFYNKKAMGVRYLERSLIKSGYKVYTLFLKDFNSVNPKKITARELALLKELVSFLDPGLIGLSVMSSLYLETVICVNTFLHNNFAIPIIWGGVYASLFPGKSLEFADFVLRGEGEEAVIELADAVLNGKPYESIRNLAYKKTAATSQVIINDLRPLCQDLDKLGYPLFNIANKFFIDKDRLVHWDPMIGSSSYELSASRGCPFTCSYCSCINLKRMYRKKGNYVRYRSVSNIISELAEALDNMKNLKLIRFWDEIFPDDRDWINEFAHQYKNLTPLPFEIWGHPLKTDDYTFKKLVDAGLYKVVMGIQSGSSVIRREIFHRSETQEEILNATKVLQRQKVPQVAYDFMLRHPFESAETIRQTYELCTKIPRPFELQLHGINFLPGTDIIKIAENKGIIRKKETEALPDRSLKEEYQAYWGQESNNKMMNFWYSLIYISQFKTGLILSKLFSKAVKSPLCISLALILPGFYYPVAKLRYYYKRALILLRAYKAKVGSIMSGKHIARYNDGN